MNFREGGDMATTRLRTRAGPGDRHSPARRPRPSYFPFRFRICSIGPSGQSARAPQGRSNQPQAGERREACRAFWFSGHSILPWRLNSTRIMKIWSWTRTRLKSSSDRVLGATVEAGQRITYPLALDPIRLSRSRASKSHGERPTGRRA
jgi:hypothetical protein